MYFGCPPLFPHNCFPPKQIIPHLSFVIFSDFHLCRFFVLHCSFGFNHQQLLKFYFILRLQIILLSPSELDCPPRSKSIKYLGNIHSFIFFLHYVAILPLN
ncbi:hypothetical protein ABFS83_11G083100 [Erythranthe nasuta]